MLRKLTSLLLVATMLLSMAIFTTASAEGEYELNCYWVGTGDSDRKEAVEAALSAYLTEKIGCTIKFHVYGWNMDTAMPTLAAGDKIDVFFTATWLQFMNCVQAGYFQPLNDLLQSDGQGILETLNPLFLQGSAVNGVNYAIPTNKELAVPDGWIVNSVAAEEVGLTKEVAQAFKTCEELEPYLAKYKELHPESYPFVMESGRWCDQPWFNTDLLGVGGVLVAQKNNFEADGSFDPNFYNIWEQEVTKTHCELMYKWMQAGYIDPGANLTTYQFRDVIPTGAWLFSAQPLKGNDIKSAETIQSFGSDEQKAALAAGNNPFYEIVSAPKLASEFSGSMLAIPTSSENPQKAMQFINLMHTDAKFINMILYGIEGEDWHMDGDFVVLDNPVWQGAHGGAWTMGNTQLQHVTVGEDPNKNALLISYADDAILLPNAGFAFDTSVVESELAAIKNVYDKYQLSLMCGNVDPNGADGIAAYVADLKVAGIDVVVAAMQSQYDAWVAEKTK